MEGNEKKRHCLSVWPQIMRMTCAKNTKCHGAIESQSLANISIAKSPFLDRVQPVRGSCILFGKCLRKDLGSFLVRQNPIRICWKYLL